MIVELKTYITREVPSENRYLLNITVIDAINIDIDVLVFDTEHNTFSHVATVYDMESYPSDRTQASVAGLQFYRSRGVSREFASIAEATYFETITKSRLSILANTWKSRLEDFENRQYVTFTAGA